MLASVNDQSHMLVEVLLLAVDLNHQVEKPYFNGGSVFNDRSGAPCVTIIGRFRFLPLK